MTNLDSILKSRDITLPTKICLVKAMVFPVVMYGCESWTVKRAEALEMGHRKAASAMETRCVQAKRHLFIQCWCFPSPQRAEAAGHRKQASGAQSKADMGRERMVDEAGEEKCNGEKH